MFSQRGVMTRIMAIFYDVDRALTTREWAQLDRTGHRCLVVFVQANFLVQFVGFYLARRFDPLPVLTMMVGLTFLFTAIVILVMARRLRQLHLDWIFVEAGDTLALKRIYRRGRYRVATQTALMVVVFNLMWVLTAFSTGKSFAELHTTLWAQVIFNGLLIGTMYPVMSRSWRARIHYRPGRTAD